MSEPPQPRRQPPEDLRDLVETPQPGLASEFWVFLKENQKWWLLPILLALLLLGALAVLSSSGLGPFIYPLVSFDRLDADATFVMSFRSVDFNPRISLMWAEVHTTVQSAHAARVD